MEQKANSHKSGKNGLKMFVVVVIRVNEVVTRKLLAELDSYRLQLIK